MSVILTKGRPSFKTGIPASHGFALLEVLISLVVLAFGLMGIAGMLVVSHKANSSSYIKQQAVQSAYDIVDRMRANARATPRPNYNVNNLSSGGPPVIPSMPSPDCNTGPCNSDQLAAFDTAAWLRYDLAQLPNGSGAVVTAASAGTATQVTVTVQWDDGPAQKKLGASSQTATGNPQLAQFILKTIL